MGQSLTLDNRSARIGRIKRYGFLVFLTPPLLPWLGVALWNEFGAPAVFAFFTIFYVYVLIPLLDLLIGKDPVNLDTESFAQLSDDRFYRLLTYACFPVLGVSLLLICRASAQDEITHYSKTYS